VSLKNSSIDYYELQGRIYERIVHGNIQKVANITKRHRSDHSREWNPDEPKNPPVCEAADELVAWKEIQPEIFEMQADFLTDVIIRLRVGDYLGINDADRVAVKGACDGLTTAMQMRDEDAERSAIVKLRAMLDSRLRQIDKAEGRTIYPASAHLRDVG